MSKKLLALWIGLSLSAKAPASIWSEWIAGGNSCDGRSVHAYSLGDWLVVTLDAFGVYMPADEEGDGLTVRKTCSFRVQLTPPAGHYLAGFRQLFAGSLSKSAGASARLQVRYGMGATAGKRVNLYWDEGTEILPDDPLAQFTREYDETYAGSACGAPTTYGFNLTLLASRPDYFGESLIGGLDAIASQVRVIPLWAPCAIEP